MECGYLRPNETDRLGKETELEMGKEGGKRGIRCARKEGGAKCTKKQPGRVRDSTGVKKEK